MNRRNNVAGWDDVRRGDTVIMMSRALWGKDYMPEFIVGVVKVDDPSEGDCMIALVNLKNGAYAQDGIAISSSGYAVMGAFNVINSPGDVEDLFNICEDLKAEWSSRYGKMHREFELSAPVMVAEILEG